MHRWEAMTDAELRDWQARAARTGRTGETGRAVLGWLGAFAVSAAFTVGLASVYFHAWPWEW